MKKYVITISNDVPSAELYHWKKTRKRRDNKKHKYIAKVEKGSTTRYFYSKEEYLAYLNGKKNPKPVETKNKNILSNVFTNKQTKNVKNATGLFDMVNKGRNITKTVTDKISTITSNVNSKPVVSELNQPLVNSFNKAKKTTEAIVSKLDKTPISNNPKISGTVAEGIAMISSFVKGGLLKVAVDEFVEFVSDKKAEKSAEEAERKAEEERRKQEEWLKWQAEENERYKEHMEEFERVQAEQREKKREAELNEQEENIQELLMSDDIIPGLDIKDEACTKDEDMEAINPYYDDGSNYEYSNNCAYCTAAYDLRQRGYDVEAAAIEWPNPNTIEVIADWYEGEKITTCNDILEQANNPYLTHKEAANLIERDLAQEGDGARGHFCLYWSNGSGGHDVVWEVENNKVVLRDCQTNQTHNVYDLLQYANYFEYFRTDNVDINPSITKTVINSDENDRR